MDQPLGQQVISTIVAFLLEYNVLLLGACFFGYLLLQFKEEYFPNRARVYELAPALLELNLRRKYLCKTSKYLKNLTIRTRL